MLFFDFSAVFVMFEVCVLVSLSLNFELRPADFISALSFQPGGSAKCVKELVPGCRGWLSLEPGVSDLVPSNPLGLHLGEGQL